MFECCLKFNAAGGRHCIDHWEVWHQRPWSVSKLETLALTAFATLSLSLTNQNQELCDALENPKMIYTEKLLLTTIILTKWVRFSLTQQVNWEVQQITATARSGRISWHRGAAIWQQNESGPEFLNLVQFYLPDQSWQDDKKYLNLMIPIETTRKQRLSSILFGSDRSPRRANVGSPSVRLCVHFMHSVALEES